MMKLWRALLALTALGAVSYFVLSGDDSWRSAPEKLSNAGASIQMVPIQPPKTPASPTAPTPASNPENIIQRQTPETLTEAIRLRNLKLAGSFAMSMQLQEMCIETKQNVVDGRARPPSPDPAIEAKRVRARQELATRCDALADTIDLREPLSDDKAGQQFMTDLRNIYGSTGFAPAGLKKLAEQRALPLAVDYIASRDNAIVLGKPYGGLPRDEFIKAVRLADLTSTPSSQALNEIRMLRYCAELAACGADPQSTIELALNNGNPIDMRTLDVARRISQALQSNDATIFGDPAAQIH